MSLRKELVALMGRPGANVSELCARFGVSRKTAYKWKKRADLSPDADLADRSSRPLHSPRRVDDSVEQNVLAVRRKHSTWSGRKIRRQLQNQSLAAPAASTVTRILARHGLICPEASERATPWKRFEHASPNSLWQVDFKGHFGMNDGLRCHPLTVLDDHSRFLLGLFACANERGETVRGHFRLIFQRYGLPRMMLCDNGPPWGCSHDQAYTKIDLWLLRLGVIPLHGKPWHPQTQGKVERLHRTLGEEALAGVRFSDLSEVQPALEAWRSVYNFERPHDALNLDTPGSRYTMSPRAMPSTEPILKFGMADELRQVNAVGRFSFKSRQWQMGEAFAGERIGLAATTRVHEWEIRYGPHTVGKLDLESREIAQLRPTLPQTSCK